MKRVHRRVRWRVPKSQANIAQKMSRSLIKRRTLCRKKPSLKWCKSWTASSLSSTAGQRIVTTALLNRVNRVGMTKSKRGQTNSILLLPRSTKMTTTKEVSQKSSTPARSVTLVWWVASFYNKPQARFKCLLTSRKRPTTPRWNSKNKTLAMAFLNYNQT